MKTHRTTWLGACALLGLVIGFSGIAGAQTERPALVADLGNVDDATRVVAHEALVKEGDAAIEALVDGLDSSNSLVRWDAARVLGEIGNPTAAPRLIELLQDEQEYMYVCRAAAVALGKCKGEGATDALVTYMRRDPVGGAEALGFLGDTSILPELMSFLIDLDDDYFKLRRQRGTNPEYVAAQEPKVAGSLAVVSAALCRLGCRGGVPPLIDSTKFTEWVGMYARGAFKEYLGEEMPRILPGLKRNENIDTLQVHSALARFFDDGIDSYVHPAEFEPADPALIEKSRRILAVLDQGPLKDQERRTKVLAALGRPIIPLLIEEFSNPSSPAHLSENVIRAIYQMGGALRVARTPRMTRRVFDDLSEGIRACADLEAKGHLIRLVGDFLHWWPFQTEVETFAEAFSVEVYANILQLRDEAKVELLSYLESDEPSTQVATLEALRRLGDSDLAEPVDSVLQSTDNDDVRIAAIQCLEWIRFESGRATLQSSDIVEGDFSERVRLEAARSLALIEGTNFQGIPALMDFLASEDAVVRARAVDALRIAADRYFGFDPEADAADRATALARWQAWYDENIETHRVNLARVRNRQFEFYNSTRNQQEMMRRELDRFEKAFDGKPRVTEFKSFYRHQHRFLPYLIDRYDQIDESIQLFVANLIASRFDKALSMPFLAKALATSDDTQVQLAAIDIFGLLPEDGLTEREAEALVPMLLPILEDESKERIVRIAAAKALSRLGDASGIGFLIEGLTLADPIDNAGWLRDESFEALKRAARMAGHRDDFGYEPNAPQSVRTAAAERWSQWWKEAQGSIELETLVRPN